MASYDCASVHTVRSTHDRCPMGSSHSSAGHPVTAVEGTAVDVSVSLDEDTDEEIIETSSTAPASAAMTTAAMIAYPTSEYPPLPEADGRMAADRAS